MNKKLKKIQDQVIVITGASSGIGLATARLASSRRAKVVLLARSESALQSIANDLANSALAITCDVADRIQVQQAAEKAIERFGRIDTWINNAGQGLWGKLDQSNEKDSRRLFDINFWGVVNGSQVALPFLRQEGGALINVGSEVSEAASPFLGIYVASKHAVKGYTDVLRIEIEQMDQAKVAITLIEPTAVNTPFADHAKNLTDRQAKLPNSKIEPEQVAEAILHAAESPTRLKRVGGMSTLNVTVSKLFPGAADKLSAKRAAELQTNQQPEDPEGTLYRPCEQTSLVASLHGVQR